MCRCSAVTALCARVHADEEAGAGGAARDLFRSPKSRGGFGTLDDYSTEGGGAGGDVRAPPRGFTPAGLLASVCALHLFALCICLRFASVCTLHLSALCICLRFASVCTLHLFALCICLHFASVRSSGCAVDAATTLEQRGDACVSRSVTLSEPENRLGHC